MAVRVKKRISLYCGKLGSVSLMLENRALNRAFWCSPLCKYSSSRSCTLLVLFNFNICVRYSVPHGITATIYKSSKYFHAQIRSNFNTWRVYPHIRSGPTTTPAADEMSGASELSLHAVSMLLTTAMLLLVR